eukprot:jgi/Hompol1/5283/HPOL_004306-RA
MITIIKAKASSKKLAERNKKILGDLRLQSGIILALHIIVRLIIFRNSLTTWTTTLSVGCLATSILLFLSFESIGGPRGGSDLADEKGLISYMWDVLYISWFCLLGSCVSDYVYWTTLAIPAIGIYKLASLASGFLSIFKGASGAANAEQQDKLKPTKSKKSK